MVYEKRTPSYFNNALQGCPLLLDGVNDLFLPLKDVLVIPTALLCNLPIKKHF